jgi:hypothetical protein
LTRNAIDPTDHSHTPAGVTMSSGERISPTGLRQLGELDELA